MKLILKTLCLIAGLTSLFIGSVVTVGFFGRLTDLSRTNLLLDNLPGWGAMAGGLLGLYCGLRGDRKAKA